MENQVIEPQEQKKWWQSATKLVLILFSLASVVGFLMGKLDSALFSALVTMVLGAYFSSGAGNKNTK